MNKIKQLHLSLVIKALYHLVLVCSYIMLMVSCTTSPTTPASSNEVELATYPIEIDLLGTKNEALVDSQGRLKTSVQATSAEGTVSLSLDKDAILLDEEGKPLQLIQATIDPNPPPPPEEAHILGAVYDLRPQGATFDPMLKLILSYDPNALPQGLREGDVYIACYEESKWDMGRYKQVDTERHRVATRIDHAARYAVLAPREHPTSDTPSTPATSSVSVDRVDVAYFHRTQRCRGCIYAEAGIRFTVENYFADELASSKLTFEVFNVEEDENATIIKKYGAFTSSLFINTIRDGTDHIEEVREIWFLLGNDEAFVEVVALEIEASLKGTR